MRRVRELYPRLLTPNYKLDKLFKIEKMTIDNDKRESVRYKSYYEEFGADIRLRLMGLPESYLAK